MRRSLAAQQSKCAKCPNWPVSSGFCRKRAAHRWLSHRLRLLDLCEQRSLGAFHSARSFAPFRTWLWPHSITPSEKKRTHIPRFSLGILLRALGRSPRCGNAHEGPPQNVSTLKYEIPRCARDFASRLPLGFTSLTPAKRLNGRSFAPLRISLRAQTPADRSTLQIFSSGSTFFLSEEQAF